MNTFTGREWGTGEEDLSEFNPENIDTDQMKRGVTILPVKGGYTGDEKNMLVCAVRKSEVAKLTKLIWTVDDSPFIIETEAGEILGEGFKGKNEGN